MWKTRDFNPTGTNNNVWEVIEEVGLKIVIKKDNNLIRVADLHSRDNDLEEQSNATLISQAPEMLSILQTIDAMGYLNPTQIARIKSVLDIVERGGKGNTNLRMRFENITDSELVEIEYGTIKYPKAYRDLAGQEFERRDRLGLINKKAEDKRYEKNSK